MGGDVALIEYLVLAVLLAFIVMKLYGVLGRRTGHERPPSDRFTVNRDVQAADEGAAESNVVTLPQQGAAPAQEHNEEAIAKVAPAGSPLAKGLMDIQLADRSFEPDSFLAGAKSAYEMIVTAFAKGDRGALRPLLSADVMEGFEAAIDDRESRSESMDFTFIGVQNATMTEASLVDRIAEVTVKFVSEVISVKKNENGAVIEGDPSHVAKVTDHWTFARDTRSADPNWHLVATTG